MSSSKSQLDLIHQKIYTLDLIIPKIKKFKEVGKSIVFTNGCFDIIHRGHIEYLAKASDYGDVFIIGLNSDDSVKRLKGESRPINQIEARALVLASFQFIDFVVDFNEDTPYNLISNIIPDVLVKGGDYQIKDIVGHDIVGENGGKTITIPFVEGFSTTGITQKLSNND